jgi:hypothetical protein
MIQNMCLIKKIFPGTNINKIVCNKDLEILPIYFDMHRA